MHCIHQGQGLTPKDGRDPDSPRGSGTPAATRGSRDNRGRPGKLIGNPSWPTLPKGSLQTDSVPPLHLNTTLLSPNLFFLSLTSPSARNPLRMFNGSATSTIKKKV